MAKRERDFSAIIKGCQSFEKATENARNAAKLLLREAGVARGTLKDSYSSKNISAIENLAVIILQTTAKGEERIRTVEEKAKKDRDFFER